MRIAFLEDDVDQASRLTALLQGAGHRVHSFERGRALLKSLVSESYDLLILDWELPDESGLEVLKSIRGVLANATPVLFLTHRDSEIDVVQTLEAGADDFVVKPPRERELLSRVDALLRRANSTSTPIETLHVAPYRIDFEHRRIECDGQAVELSPREYAVAALLFRNLGKVVSRGHIMDVVWGRGDVTTTRTVDMHVSRIRAALGLSTAIGLRLTAVYGYGYRLERVVKETE